MKNKIIKSILLVGFSVLTISCESWLDVVPKSQVREDMQFNTVAGFQQALVGCYIQMGAIEMYGRNMSWYAPELLAHQYADNSTEFYYRNFRNYDYKNMRSEALITSMWDGCYTVIANANNALKFLDTKRDFFDIVNHSVIKGELLAIRAMMHFELIRLYGHSYLEGRSDKATRQTIPYVTVLDKNVTPQESYEKTLVKLIADLQEAVTLLEYDPLSGKYPKSTYNLINADGFFNNRISRLNYYAAQTMLARVYMWEGSPANVDKALTLVQAVINDVTTKNIVSMVSSANEAAKDPQMKSEHIMNIVSTKAYSEMIVSFTDNATQGIHTLLIKESTAREIYEAVGGTTDYRFGIYMYHTCNNGDMISKKLMPTGGNIFNFAKPSAIPVIRLPELYYMAAECYLRGSNVNVGNALSMLNQVRVKRGLLVPLAEMGDMDKVKAMDEIVKEYRKEFITEGVMFYMLKRLGRITIPDYLKEAGDAVYMLPYPVYEEQMGIVQ